MALPDLNLSRPSLFKALDVAKAHKRIRPIIALERRI